jgi:hypothetical protein
MFANLLVNLEGLRYHDLSLLEEAHKKDTERLRSITGPALFENLLLGFDAGKDLFFDPFSGSLMIASGRVPEETLTGAITQQQFSVIVTTSDLEERVRNQRRANAHVVQPAAYFNGGILEAISENYELLEQTDTSQAGKKLKTPDGYAYYQHFFYVPRSDKRVALSVKN